MKKIFLFIICFSSVFLVGCSFINKINKNDESTIVDKLEKCTINFYYDDRLYLTESYNKNDIIVFPEIENVPADKILGDWLDSNKSEVSENEVAITNASYYIYSYESINVKYVLDVENEEDCINERIRYGGWISNKKVIKEDYEFLGWFFDKEFTKPLVPVARHFSDEVLYAKWNKIAWNLKCGDYITLKHVSKITEFPNITMTGYILEGWYYEDDTKANIGDVLTEDTTIHPNWVLDVEGWDVSYDDWLGVSYDEVETQKYYDGILKSPEYIKTEYEDTNNIDPDIDVKHYYMTVRLYFDKNIPENKIKYVNGFTNNNSVIGKNSYLVYKIYSNYIEIQAPLFSTSTFEIVLTNYKSKTYEIPNSKTKEYVSFDIDDFVIKYQSVKENGYYEIPAKFKDYLLPQDAEVTVKCDDGNSYDMNKGCFKILYSNLANNQEKYILNYTIEVYTDENDYTIRKHCSKTFDNISYVLVPSEASVSYIVYTQDKDDIPGRTLVYTFNTELPIDESKLDYLKMQIIIDGVEYNENKFKKSLSSDKKTLSLRFYGWVYPKTHDNENLEYEITKSKFWLDGDNSFEFELTDTLKYMVHTASGYIYDIYNIHFGTDGYFYFDSTLYSDDYDLLKLAFYFYTDDDSERIVYITELNGELENFEYNTRYRIYSSKMRDTSYSSFSLADVVIFNLETDEMIKVNDTYGGYGTTFEIK